MPVDPGPAGVSLPTGSPAAAGSRPRIGLGIGVSYANTVVGLACNLLAVPLYLRYLGPEDYGLWVTAAGLAAHLGLLNLGLAQATANRFAVALARGEEDRAGRTLATGFWSYAGTVVPAFLVVAALAGLVPWGGVFKGSPAMQARAPWVLLAVSGALLAELPLQVFPACLRAIGGIHVQQASAMAQNVARLLVAVLYLPSGGGLLGLVLLLGGVNLLAHVAALLLLRRRAAAASPRWSLRDRRLARELREPGLYYLLLQVAGAAVVSIPPLVISSSLGTAAVASFAVAQRVAAIGVGLADTMTANFGPSLLRSHSLGLMPALRSDFLRALVLSAGVGTTIGLALLAEGPAFIRWWLGPANFVGEAPFALIVGMVFVQMVLNPCDTLLVVTAQHRLYALSALWEALLVLGLSLALVRPWEIAGVAGAALLARALGAGPVMLWESARVLQKGLPAMLLRVGLCAAVGAAIATALNAILPEAGPGPGPILHRAGAIGAAFALVFALLTRRFGLGKG